MSSLPTHVQVGPMRYSVERDQAAVNAKASSKTAYGVSVHHEQRILIAEGLGSDQEADTMSHEVLHACLTVYGLDLPFDDALLERLIYGLSAALLDTLRRNPELVAYLVGGEAP